MSRSALGNDFSSGPGRRRRFAAGGALSAVVLLSTIILGSVASAQVAGWQSQDIGVALAEGGHEFVDGQHVVTGGGVDIWDRADQFHFAYQYLDGDGSITARVAAVDFAHEWTKAGVMIREHLSTESRHASALRSPNAGTRSAQFARRTTVNGTSAADTHGSVWAPTWLRVVRAGNVFTAFRSEDGVAWTQMGGAITMDNFAPGAYVGLAVTSHAGAVLASAKFDNVSTTGNAFEAPVPADPTPLPAGWHSADIGVVRAKGWAHVEGVADISNTTVTVVGGGADITGSSDRFHYLYTYLVGDGSIQARISDLTPVHAWSKAGVMIRSSLEANAAHGAALRSSVTNPDTGATNGILMQARETNGGGTFTTPSGDNRPKWPYGHWLRVERTGTTITARVSQDGETWTQLLEPKVVALGEGAYIGLVASPHDFGPSGGLTVATFTDVVVTGNVVDPPIIPVPEPIIPTPLPGFLDINYGDAIQVPGYISVSDEGVHTISGSGSNIWGTADNGYFVYQRLSGDGTIVARILTAPHTGQDPAKVGVMIRETLERNSKNASVIRMPDRPNGFIGQSVFQNRRTTGGDTIATNRGEGYPDGRPQIERPVWLKLVREGNMFSGYTSADGTTWIQLTEHTGGGPNTVEIPMNEDVYIGFCLQSHSAGLRFTATFDSVEILGDVSDGTPPPAKILALPFGYDLGTVEVGSAPQDLSVRIVNSSNLTEPLEVSGVDIAGLSDFAFVDLTFNGSSSDVNDTFVLRPNLVDVLEIKLRFDPAAAGPGGFNEELTVFSSDPDIPELPIQFTASVVESFLADAAPIRGGLAIHLDADMIKNRADGEQIAVWTDRSGAGNHATQSVFAEQPTFVSNAFDGKPAVRFGGGRQALRYNNVNAYAAFLVVKENAGTTPSNRPLLGHSESAAFHRGDNNAFWSPQWGGANVYQGVTRVNGVAVDGAYDRVPTEFSVISVVTANGAADTNQVGRDRNYNDRGWNGEYAEVLIYNRPLSADEINRTIAYLQAKYNTTPAGWDATDIGRVSNTGLFGEYNGVVSVTGNGGDLWGNFDGTRFVYRRLSGDGTITARVLSVDRAAHWTKAGVLIRENLTNGSKYVGAFKTPNAGERSVQMQWRSAQNGGTSGHNVTNLWTPTWVRVRREGTTFTAWTSLNGVNWNQMRDPVSVEMGQDVYIGMAVSANASWGRMADATFDNITIEGAVSAPPVIEPTPAPDGWLSLDVGDPHLPGYSYVQDGKVHVMASGADMWGNNDHFHFVAQKMTGMNGSITAKLESVPHVDDWAKAGVMIRETLGSGSRYSMTHSTPTRGDGNNNGTRMQFRTNTNGGSSDAGSQPLKVPVWLRLERNGNVFTSRATTDGVTWIHLADRFTTMTEQVYVGLAFTSHNNNRLVPAVFSEISIEGFDFVDIDVPAPTPTPAVYPTPLADGWASGDVGRVGITGRAFGGNAGMSVIGSGGDIWGNADEFHFAYKILDGDGSITARVESMTEVHDWAKTGVMMRETLLGNSKHIMLTPRTKRQDGGANNTLQLAYRTSTGGGSASQEPGGAHTWPIWLRITRAGNAFTASWSDEGTTWTQFGNPVTIPMNQKIFIGLPSLSHDNGQLETVRFTNIATEGTVSDGPRNAPTLVSTLGAYDFGSLARTDAPRSVSFKVYNDGVGPLFISSVSPNLAGFDVDRLDLNGEPMMTPISVTLRNRLQDVFDVTITFDPNQAAGAYRGTIAINSNDPIFPTAQIVFTAAVFDEVSSNSPIQDGLLLHLDSAYLAGRSDGDRIANWLDASGGRNDAVQWDANIQPTVYNDVLNGRPVVRFNGANQMLRFNQVNGIRTVFWVLKENAGTAHSDRPLLGELPTEGEPFFHRGGNGALWNSTWGRSEVYNGATLMNGAPVNGSTTALPQGNFNIVSLTTTGNASARQIGRDRDFGNRGWNGDYAEVIIFDRPLTQVETNEMYAYLRTKYNMYPEGWLAEDIGGTNLPGLYANWAGEHHIMGSGADIWGTNDAFHYAYRRMVGNGSITARVRSVTYEDGWTKAGIMIRANNAPNAANVGLFQTPNAGERVVSFQRRPTAGAESANVTVGNMETPRWLRLTRSGNTYTAYQSGDGTNWSQVGDPVDVDLGAGSHLVGLAITSHNNSRMARALIDNVEIVADGVMTPVLPTPIPTPTPSPYPPEWLSVDVGNVANPGRFFGDNASTLTIMGSGGDIWGTADGFHYAAQLLDGDGTITAKVESLAHVHDWAKAGVMMRETLHRSSKHAFTLVTPRRGDGATNGTNLQFRTTTGGESGSAGNSNTHAPVWVRLSRAGTVFSASGSTDSETWFSLGQVEIEMANQIYVGLAVCAQTNGTLAKAEFTNVTIEGTVAIAPTPIPTPPPATPVPTPLAAGWLNVDVGMVGAKGRSFGDPATSVTVYGSGGDIWGSNDQFQFVYKELRGNGSIVTTLTDYPSPRTWSKAGVMIRETLNNNSKHAMMAMTGQNNTQFLWRTDTNGGSSSVGGGQPDPKIPAYLRLERAGDAFTAFWSGDGETWTQMGDPVNIAMNADVYIGLALMSLDNNVLQRAVFEQTTLTGNVRNAAAPKPMMQLSTASVNFGTVQRSQLKVTQTLRLSNISQHFADLDIAQFLTGAMGSFYIDRVLFNGEVFNPPYTNIRLNPPFVDVLDIVFALDVETVIPGDFTGSFVIQSNDGAGALRTVALTATVAMPPDADGDGKPDDCETTDPSLLRAEGSQWTHALLADTDGDGLLDGQEMLPEGCYATRTDVWQTDPRNRDTDGDGFWDGMEALILGSNPLDPTSPSVVDPNFFDADGDGLPAHLDPDDNNPDSDGDGFADGYEVLFGSDPEDPDSTPSLGDANGDGEFNNIDSVMVFNHALGNVPVLPASDNADANLDGVINNIDAIVFFNFNLGNLPLLPFIR